MSFSTEVKQEVQAGTHPLAVLFVKHGYVANPAKNYHLELVFGTADACQAAYAQLCAYEFKAKTITRRGQFVTYLKDSEQIVDFLSLIGAHHAVMAFHNSRILKDISGKINRQVNLEAANLEKTITAALAREAHLKAALAHPTLVLAPELVELAKARLTNMDATLKELGETFDPPLSKSCVNHRLRKIKKIADQL